MSGLLLPSHGLVAYLEAKGVTGAYADYEPADPSGALSVWSFPGFGGQVSLGCVGGPFHVRAQLRARAGEADVAATWRRMWAAYEVLRDAPAPCVVTAAEVAATFPTYLAGELPAEFHYTLTVAQLPTIMGRDERERVAATVELDCWVEAR